MKQEKKEEIMSVSHKTSLLAESKKRAKSAMKRKSKVGFLQELKNELKKVSWTSREELTTCTKIVVGATLFFGVGIYVVDLLLRNLLQGIHALSRLIMGA